MHQPQPQQQQRQQGGVAATTNLSATQNSWFAGAPASKLFIAFSVFLYIFVHHNNSNNYNGINKQHQNDNLWQFDSMAITGFYNSNNKRQYSNHQYYRYITSKLTFVTNSELIIGTSLQIFLYRKYERELSTRKFLLYIIIILLLSIIQEIFIINVIITSYNRLYIDSNIHNKFIRWKYSGPYTTIGGLFTLFHLYTPRIHPRFISILSQLQLSEKSIYYLWFIHFIYSNKWNTIIPTCTGIISTLLYLHIPFLQYSIDFPNRLVNIVQPIFHRLGISEPTPTPIRTIAAAAAAAAAQQQQQQQPGRIPTANNNALRQQQHQQQEQVPIIPMPEPDPDAVEQLTSMGFPRQQVMEALRQTHNNVEHAANRLLSAPTS